MLENEGGFDDVAHLLEGFDKARLLSVAIPENAFYRAGQVPELPCRERGDEVAGVDDQAAFRVIEKPDRAPESDQVVMGVRKDADHEGIIEELDKLDKLHRLDKSNGKARRARHDTSPFSQLSSLSSSFFLPKLPIGFFLLKR